MYNKRHSDGSIKIDDEVNIVVSPYFANFYDEIEDGIKETVRTLLELGYLTISSCQGTHGEYPVANVVVVVDSSTSAKELMFDLSQLGIISTMDHSFDHFGIEEINKLFFRQYTDYRCVKIWVYNPQRFVFPFNNSWLVRTYFIKRTTSYLKKLKKYLS
jgi:hypothetical protein